MMGIAVGDVWRNIPVDCAWNSNQCVSGTFPQPRIFDTLSKTCARSTNDVKYDLDREFESTPLYFGKGYCNQNGHIQLWSAEMIHIPSRTSVSEELASIS